MVRLGKSEKQKVLWLWDRLDSLGGVEIVILNIAKKLDRNKYDIYMAVFQDGPIRKMFEEIGVKVAVISRNKKFDLKTFYHLYHFIKDEHIDIIHTHGHFPGIAGRIAGRLLNKKIVSTYHLALNEDGHPYLTKKVTKITLPLANYVTFVSKGVEESFYFDSMVFDEKLILKRKHFTIYNGIDLTEIEKIISTIDISDIRKKLSIANNDAFLMTAGRLTEQKGHYYLIKAMQEVTLHFPNVKLLIFGDGELKQTLNDLIKTYDLVENVSILTPTKEIIQIMASADIFVVPSLWEGLPMALLEAMAVGMPVVASNVTGINEIIKDGVNGVLVEAKNEKGLSESIIKLIKNEEFRKNISNNARKTVIERFTLEKMVESYEYLYKR